MKVLTPVLSYSVNCLSIVHTDCTPSILFSVPEFVESQRTGRTMIKLGKYLYSQRPSNRIKKRWVCSTHVFRGCKATLYTVDDEILSCGAQKHNH